MDGPPSLAAGTARPSAGGTSPAPRFEMNDVTDLLLLVVAQVLEIVITLNAGAPALICIVTGVSIMVYDQLLAATTAHVLSVSRPNAALALCRPCVGCW